MGGIAESYRPGGTYSRYMGGRILSQAEESVGQETSRMIASGITSPSMMRQMGIQSRRQAQASLPGMEMQVSQMALPYEQLASGYFGEYTGLGEQIAGLKTRYTNINSNYIVICTPRKLNFVQYYLHSNTSYKN